MYPVRSPIRIAFRATALAVAGFALKWACAAPPQPGLVAVASDPDTGIARSFAPGGSARYAGSPEQAARKFVKCHLGLLGAAAGGEMRARTGADGPLGRQVTLQQTVRGVPVLGRTLNVNVAWDGRILSAENKTAALPSVDVRPRLSPLAAIARYPGELLGAPELAIDGDATPPRLVWQFLKRPSALSLKRVTVDARSGELLGAHELTLAVAGAGRVYTGNPVSTPYAIMAPLPGLIGDGYLTGPYVQVFRFQNYDEPVVSGWQEVHDLRNLYLYADRDPRMGQVQVYYGMNRAHDYFKTALGFQGIDICLPAYVLWYGLDNAYYLPGHPPNGAMVFGQQGGIDLALDTDVLFHEYVHAVTDRINTAWTRAGEAAYEASGISEGIADYFSCSMQNDPFLGEYAGLIYDENYVRRLTSINRFPEDAHLPMMLADGSAAATFPQVHQIGKIWGAAAWDLRELIGTSVTDRLMFAVVGLLTPETRLQDALVHLLAVDSELNGGAHAITICKVFRKRGITLTACPIAFLRQDAFASTGIRTGFVRLGPGETFVEEYNFAAYGVFPSYVAGRRYAIPGYVRNSSTRSVFVVFRDADNRVLSRFGTDTTPMVALDSSGQVSIMSHFSLVFTLPESVLPAGQDRLSRVKMSLQTSATPASSASKLIAAARPTAVSRNYRAQILREPIYPPGVRD